MKSIFEGNWDYEKKNAFLRKKVAFVLIFLSRNPMHLEYEEYIRRKFGNN